MEALAPLHKFLEALRQLLVPRDENTFEAVAAGKDPYDFPRRGYQNHLVNWKIIRRVEKLAAAELSA
jgi:hypothetical protein